MEGILFGSPESLDHPSDGTPEFASPDEADRSAVDFRAQHAHDVAGTPA
jgi:hypothetical protein